MPSHLNMFGAAAGAMHCQQSARADGQNRRNWTDGLDL